MNPTSGQLILLSGSAHPELAAATAHASRLTLGRALLERYPDRELRVEILEDLFAKRVFVLQPLSPPAEVHLLELLLLADAARRGGAQSVTAVIPYLAYARQDRRVTGREPLGIRVIAEMIESAGIERLIAIDLHSAAAETAFRIPVEHLSAIGILSERLQSHRERAVIVSPDSGGLKRAEAYATRLDLPVAVIHKRRASGSQVEARGVVGTIEGLSPIIVDDMVTTGETVEAAIAACLRGGCAPPITVAVTHAVLAGDATERLRHLRLQQFWTTDSVPPGAGTLEPTRRVSIAPLLAAAIVRTRGAHTR